MKKTILHILFIVLTFFSLFSFVSADLDNGTYTTSDGLGEVIITDNSIEFYYDGILRRTETSTNYIDSDFIAWNGTTGNNVVSSIHTNGQFFYQRAGTSSFGAALGTFTGIYHVAGPNYSFVSEGSLIYQSNDNKYYVIGGGQVSVGPFTFTGDLTGKLFFNGEDISNSSSGYVYETSPGCFVKETELITYPTTFAFDVGDYSYTSSGNILLVTENTLDEFTKFELSGMDTILNFTGSVLNEADGNLFRFNTHYFSSDVPEIKISNSYGISGITLTGSLSTLDNYYHIKTPSGEFILDDDGNKVKYKSGIDYDFGTNFDYITLVFWKSNILNITIDTISLRTKIITTQSEEFCTELTDEAKQNFTDSVLDNFDLSNYSTFDTELCSGFAIVNPSCWFAQVGNLLIAKIEIPFIKEFVFSLGNIINFSIPSDYEVKFRTPTFQNGLFGDFEENGVVLDENFNPDIAYIYTDGERQLQLNGDVIYTMPTSPFARFFYYFIPVLVSMIFFVLSVLFIGFLLLPGLIFHNYFQKLIGFITPDLKKAKKSSGNLIILGFFVAFSVLLYAVFAYLMGLYIVEAGEISYEFRGFIGTFFIFLLNLFQFNGVDIQDILFYLNGTVYGMIATYIIYLVVNEFGRLN